MASSTAAKSSAPARSGSSEKKGGADDRLASLDAYRGFVMICLAGAGFGIAAAAQNFPLSASPAYQRVAVHFEHVRWVGCAFWDLIQPSFMFMVGVSMAYSYAKRKSGGTWGHLALHAAIRSIVLVLLGIFLRSTGTPTTNFTFMDVLSQIGLGYFFLFLLWDRPPWVQTVTAVSILVAYWAWFAVTPLPGPDFNYAVAGVEADRPLLTGFAAHWEKGSNPAAAFDRWFLNLFPRIGGQPFVYDRGGYVTLNFIPSIVTMLLGLMAGELIRTTPNRLQALGILVLGGLFFLGSGWALGQLGICPIVKRIWTPSWVLFSAGWTLLLLSAFYTLMDVLGWKWLGYPLIVAGANSILLYILSLSSIRNWTAYTLQKHFGSGIFNLFGEPYVPVVASCGVLLVFWLFVFWLYRQKIFLKI